MYEPFLPAILVAAILPMVIGSVWYGPVFGKMWLGLVGKTEDEIKESMSPIKMYVVSFVMALIMAYVMAHVVEAFATAYPDEPSAQGIAGGLSTGFFAWLGFVLTVGYQAVAFEDKKLRVFGLNMAYNLVSLLAMGMLLGVWR